jgi:hypothetical protein
LCASIGAVSACNYAPHQGPENIYVNSSYTFDENDCLSLA